MSRKHKVHGHNGRSRYPTPPKKTVWCNDGKPYRKTVNTEFHDAVVSFGRNNKTSRLSDEELLTQILKEAGYLADVGWECFRSAGKALSEIIKFIL